MSSVILKGSTSGDVTVKTEAVAGSNIATIGAATGTHYPFTAGTAAASTSGTSIDFTGIPSWVKRITVMFNGVSTNGSSPFLLQIGSVSVSTTGYDSVANVGTAGGFNSTSTIGFILDSTSTHVAATLASGVVTICSVNGNYWVSSGNIKTGVYGVNSAGVSPSISGALDRVRITTVNGTDTFDAGSINILYE